MSSYLDASVLLPTLIAEPATEAVYDFLGAEGRELLISDFAAAEVASALSRLVRMALLTDADASARLADFDAWRAAMSQPVDIRVRRSACLHLCPALRSRLRAPDALHLAIARRLDATLVTLDRRLAAAARDLGIAVEELKASRAGDQEKAMADDRSPVEDHYTRRDLGEVILAALKAAGRTSTI